MTRSPAKPDDRVGAVGKGESQLERWTNKLGCLSGIILLVVAIVIPIGVMLISAIIGVQFKSEEFGEFYGRVIAAGFLLLLVALLLKLYIKVVKPVMGLGSRPDRVPEEAEGPTELVLEAQAESLPSITEHTTELLAEGEVREKESRRIEPGSQV